MDVITITTLAYLLILGIVFALLGRTFKFPFRVLLIFVGMFLAIIPEYGVPIKISPELIYAVLVFSLPLAIFDSFARLRHSHSDKVTHQAFHFSAVLFIVSLVLVGGFAFVFFNSINSLFIAAFLGLILVASSHFDLFDLDIKIPIKYQKFLLEESHLSSALMFLFAAVILSIVTFFDGFLIGMDLFLGIGIGFLTGLLVLKFVNKKMHHGEGKFFVMLVAIFTFLFAEVMNGNGIVAVAVMAYFFGNSSLHNKREMHEFSTGVVEIAEIMLFIVAGFVATQYFSFGFIMAAVILYIVFLICRMLILHYYLFHEYTIREQVFMALYSPKGTSILSMLMFVFLFAPEEFKVIIPILIIVVMISQFVSYLVGYQEKHIVKK